MLGWVRSNAGLLLVGIIFWGLVVLLPVRPVSAAPVLMENFNNNSFDHSVWSAEVVGTGPIVNVANDQLVVTIPPLSVDNPTYGAFGGALVSSCLLKGDFDMQVGFQLVTWPQNSGVRTGLGSILLLTGLGSSSTNHYSVERDNFAVNEFTHNDAYVTDFLDGVQGFIPASGSSVMLRIARSGGYVTGYYFNGGGWTIIHSGPIALGEVGLGFGAWSHNYIFSHQQSQVAFDNFTLNTGQLVCPTLTASPTSGPTGTKVVVTGTNFPLPASNSLTAGVEVTFDDVFLGTTTSNQGSFVFTFDVPIAQPGPHQIKAIDFSTGANGTSPFIVTLAQSPLSVSLTVGAIYFPGDTIAASVLVMSNGSPVSSSGLQLHLNLTQPDNSEIKLSVTSLGNGLFRASYSLPRTAQIGTYSLVATVNDPSVGTGSALAVFEVKLPWLSSQTSTITVAGVASVATLGVALVSWRKGYFKRSAKEPL